MPSTSAPIRRRPRWRTCSLRSAAERAAPELIELSGQPSRLRVAAEIEITSLVSQDFDEETGEVTLSDVPLSVLDGRPVYGASIVRDGDGLLHRFSADAIALNPTGPSSSSSRFGLPIRWRPAPRACRCT